MHILHIFIYKCKHKSLCISLLQPSYLKLLCQKSHCFLREQKYHRQYCSFNYDNNLDHIRLSKMQRKTAIVTGAGQGIGKTVSKGLCHDGFDLFLIDACEENLQSVIDEIQNISIKTYIDASVLDISKPDSANYVAQKAIDLTGRIDLLFNNAGVFKFGGFELSNEDFWELLNTNLMGAFFFMQAVSPIMKKNQSGHIINMASLSGKVGFSNLGAYSASKFGLVGLSESLCRELAPYGIKVSCICPSYVDTPMARQTVKCDLPKEQIILPEDIMEIIRLLLKLSAGCVIKEIFIECPCDLDLT